MARPGEPNETVTSDPTEPLTELDETLDSATSPVAGRLLRSARSSAPPPLDREGRRQLIESADRDQPELAPVDPDQYIHGYELARGGMGRIVAARDRRLGRVVAIKELIQDTPERAARFEREALITARLQHPAIVNLHEAGRWPSGQPFYAMKLVAGRSLAQVASDVCGLAERLAFLPNLIAMVEAVAYAHRQRIIHRDLKPSNVLIGDLGETVVIDWGLAKDLAAVPGDRTHLPREVEAAPAEPPGAAWTRECRRDRGSTAGSLTVAGAVMGTPGYMPPEQANAEEVDERADVYALGAILYHLLGGKAPYAGGPDAVLASVRVGPPTPLARVEPRLPQDLVTIIDKAMARAADARYPTAVQLAEDLRRFQTGQLVAAHRYSRRQLVWRFLARHRAVMVASLAALAAVAVMAFVSFRRVVAERDRAEAASVAAARRADELAVAQAGSLLDEDPRGALELLSRLSSAATPTIWRGARMTAADARLRGIPSALRGHGTAVTGFDLSSDGRVLVSADAHEVRAWDVAAGRSRALGRQEPLIQTIRLSADASAAATIGLDNRIRLWSMAGGPPLELGGHDGVVNDFHFLPDGRVLSGGADGAVILWRAGRRDVVGRHRGHVFDVAAAADGWTLASVGEDGAVRLWRPVAGEAPVELRGPTAAAALRHVALSADGLRAAAAGVSGQVWLWDVATRRGRQLVGHDREVDAIAFSPDGRRLATAGGDQTIRLWDTLSGESEVLRDHRDAIGQLAFTQGDLLFSSSRDGTVRVWMLDGKSASAVQVLGGYDGDGGIDVSADGDVLISGAGMLLRRWRVGAMSGTLRGHGGPVTQVEIADNGDVVSAADDWTVRVWPAGPRPTPRVLRGHEAGITALALSSGGRLAASVDRRRYVWLWDLASGRGRRLSGRGFGQARFSPDGTLVAAPSEEHVVRLWSTATGEARILRGHTSWVTAVAISPDGRTLASAGADRTVRLWDFATGKSRALEGHRAAVRYVEFAGPSRVVSSDLAGTVREWDLPTGVSRELARGPNGIAALAASTAGEMIAWADGEGDANLWTRRTGRIRLLPRREKGIDQLLFAPDGRTLLGRDAASRVHLWDTATGASLVLPSHGRTISDFAVSARGVVATADSDRSVRLWPYDLPYEPRALRAWMSRAAR
jgi:eukaryotic-like serine/threonine-protein kinase